MSEKAKICKLAIQYKGNRENIFKEAKKLCIKEKLIRTYLSAGHYSEYRVKWLFKNPKASLSYFIFKNSNGSKEDKSSLTTLWNEFQRSRGNSVSEPETPKVSKKNESEKPEKLVFKPNMREEIARLTARAIVEGNDQGAALLVAASKYF